MTFKKPSTFSRSELQLGFKVLWQLWDSNLLPNDLERHYFLHAFVTTSGNILRAAEKIQVHRNTIQSRFVEFGFSHKSVRFRHDWQKMIKANKKKSFETNFLRFYNKVGGRQKFTLQENAGLIGLWKNNFPANTLFSHYLLWAARTGKTNEWIQKKFNYSPRHQRRLLTDLFNTKTRNGFWLSLLKPNRKEVHLFNNPKKRAKLAKRKIIPQLDDPNTKEA